MNAKLKKVTLLSGDVVIFYLSLYFTLLVRYLKLPDERLWNDHIIPFSMIMLGWAILFYIANLYDLKSTLNRPGLMQLQGKILFIAGVIAIAFFYLTPGILIAPKRNLFIFLIIFSILFFAWRQLYYWLLKSYLPKTSIGIIGYNGQVAELITEIESSPSLGIRLAFLMDTEVIAENIRIPIIRTIDKLKEAISENKINTLVLATNPHSSPELRSLLFDCLPMKINFVGLLKFYETITGKVAVEAVNQMWFLENLNEGDKYYFDKLKRIYDIILSIIILLATIIFWPVIAFIIKRESSGPVFFCQVRLGKNGIPFSMIKFRTMTENGNTYSPTEMGDARITKTGAFMRKTRIDEIPQILNILRGDMSFVGPRPERPELVENLEKNIPFYRERMLVKPGITGWDQVSGEYHSPSHEDTLKKLQYDLFYVKNRSIYLDIVILLKTVMTVVSRGGR